MKTYKLSIKGKVTGVCFRMETLRFSANFPTLCGYVKNIAESHVEVVMQGDENSIYQMTSWLKVGPPLSCVKSVSVDVYDSPEQFPRFTINY